MQIAAASLAIFANEKGFGSREALLMKFDGYRRQIRRTLSPRGTPRLYASITLSTSAGDSTVKM